LEVRKTSKLVDGTSDCADGARKVIGDSIDALTGGADSGGGAGGAGRVAEEAFVEGGIAILIGVTAGRALVQVNLQIVVSRQVGCAFGAL
jgi:hypothetical protein